MAIVGKAFKAASLLGPDLHSPTADLDRGPMAMVVEQINQRQQHRLALLLLRIALPAKAAGGQKSLGCRALWSALMARLEKGKGDMNAFRRFD